MIQSFWIDDVNEPKEDVVYTPEEFSSEMAYLSNVYSQNGLDSSEYVCLEMMMGPDALQKWLDEVLDAPKRAPENVARKNRLAHAQLAVSGEHAAIKFDLGKFNEVTLRMTSFAGRIKFLTLRFYPEQLEKMTLRDIYTRTISEELLLALTLHGKSIGSKLDFPVQFEYQLMSTVEVLNIKQR